MTNRVVVVFKAWVDLSEDEKTEFLQALREYQEAGTIRKGQISEQLSARGNQVLMGPLRHGCPCCGR